MANSLQDFIGFMHSKAFDVISNGQFKKHLVSCKEKGDAWAVAMHGQQVRVTQASRGVQVQISRLQESPSTAPWSQICRDVIGSAQPPVKVFTGERRCSITGEDLEYSLDLTRSGRNSRETYVHLRFWHFFMMLWYVTKIEYVIRSCTKHWMDQYRDKDYNFTELCEMFRGDKSDMCVEMGELYLKGMSYVQNSVDLYKQQFQALPVLRPPQDFVPAAVQA